MNTVWKINNLERNTADDTVVTAHWLANLTDGDYSASAYGTQSFTRDENSPTFIAFEDLTEADVVGWVKESMVREEENVDENDNTVIAEVNEALILEANLQAQIDEQKAPTTVSGTPWQVEVTEAA